MNAGKRCTRAWLIGAVCLLSAHSALGASSYRAAMIEAVTAKERALDSNSAADWRDALERFRAAGTIQRAPESEYETGLAASMLGETGLAFEAYSNALELGLVGPAAARVRAFIEAHSNQVAALIVTGPAGARVLVRGIERGQLPMARAIVVEAGVITLEVVLKTGRHILRTVNVEAGQQESLTFEEPPPEELAASNPTGAPRSVPNADDHPSPGGPLTARQSQERSSRAEATPSPHRQLAWAILGSSSSVAALSVVSLIVSSKRLSDSRRDLFERCATQLGGPDTCAHAKAGQQDAAQSASDSIATWKAMRTGSWLSLSLGIAGMVTSVAWLSAGAPAQHKSAQLPTLHLTPQCIGISYAGAFD